MRSCRSVNCRSFASTVAGGKTVAEMTVRVAALRTVRVVPVVQRSHEKIRQRTEDRPRRAHGEEQPLGAGGRERRRPGSLAGTPQDFADGHDHLPLRCGLGRMIILTN